MKRMLSIPLNATPDQHARLVALQAAFSEVCNALAPTVQRTRVWNRVALHHMVYRELRERFPNLGSQMTCNAIYSVSRACRVIFQTPTSPLHLTKLSGRPLPLLRFASDCPVYFDRHTLSIKAGQLSMFTLDGRMRFHLALQPDDEHSFHVCKLRETVLQRRAEGFELRFIFASEGSDDLVDFSRPLAGKPEPVDALGAFYVEQAGSVIPAYVRVEEIA